MSSLGIFTLLFTCVSASVLFLHTEQCLACRLFLFLWDFIDPATAIPLLFLTLFDSCCPTFLSYILSSYFLPLLSQRKQVLHWLLETPHIYKPLRRSPSCRNGNTCFICHLLTLFLSTTIQIDPQHSPILLPKLPKFVFPSSCENRWPFGSL